MFRKVHGLVEVWGDACVLYVRNKFTLPGGWRRIPNSAVAPGGEFFVIELELNVCVCCSGKAKYSTCIVQTRVCIYCVLMFYTLEKRSLVTGCAAYSVEYCVYCNGQNIPHRT